VRQTAPVFHAAKQQSIAVVEANRRGVEDAVDRVRPVFAAEDWVGAVTGEENIFGVHFRPGSFTWYGLRF
jgi:hypothetical protein